MEHSKESQTKSEKPAIEVFEEAMNNIMPVLEVKARRIGGATLSGTNRGKSRQKTGFSASLAYNIFPSREARRQWKKDWQMRFLMQQTTQVHL